MDNQSTLKTYYYLDAGEGTKLLECPHYSNYQDGRDIDEHYIIPPKGYVFVGFKFEPFESDEYDGKIVAQFEKMDGIEKLRLNLWRYIAAVAILILIGMILRTVIDRRDPASSMAVNDDITIEYRDLEEATPATTNPEPANIPEDAPKAFLDTIESPADTLEPTADTIIPTADTVIEVIEKEKALDEPIADEAVANEVAANEQVANEAAVNETVVNEQVVNEQVVNEQIVEKTEPQPSAKELKAQFRKEFWTLIHQQEKRMTVYGKLYRKYNGQFKSNEFYYLTLTILESASDFNVWNANLNRIPADEIKKVRTLDALKQKLEEYE